MQQQSRRSAAQSFFRWLESRYGGNIPTDPHATVLRTSQYLQADHLQQLFQHKISALHVTGFFHPPTAQQLGSEIAAAPSQNWQVSTSRGLESSDVSTAGHHPPFNVVAGNSKREEDYFVGVHQEFRQRRIDRVTGQPRLWPLDLLRLQLEEQWQGGCGLAREEHRGRHRPFGGGLPRIMHGPTRWKRGLIHVDEMGPLSVQQGLFSANIYLQLPVSQTLLVWPTNVRSRWDWYRNALLLSGLATQDPDSQTRLRQELGDPHCIEAEPGDLVLLCVQRPHAAVGFQEQGAARVSLQCFLQHNGPSRRILVDC